MHSSIEKGSTEKTSFSSKAKLINLEFQNSWKLGLIVPWKKLLKHRKFVCFLPSSLTKSSKTFLNIHIGSLPRSSALSLQKHIRFNYFPSSSRVWIKKTGSHNSVTSFTDRYKFLSSFNDVSSQNSYYRRVILSFTPTKNFDFFNDIHFESFDKNSQAISKKRVISSITLKLSSF